MLVNMVLGKLKYLVLLWVGVGAMVKKGNSAVVGPVLDGTGKP